MNSFIDSVGQKNMKLLKIVLSEERYFSVKELCILMDMSTKTIKKLNALLVEDIRSGSSQADVLNESRLGFKLTNPSRFFLPEMEQFYLEKSMGYQIINQLFHEEFEGATAFAHKNFISISSFYKSLNRVKTILESFNLKIAVSGPAQLKGNEKEIRYFLFHFYWEAFKGMKWPFNEFNRMEIEECLTELELSLGISYSIPEKEMLYYWLTIVFQRVRSGFFDQHSRGKKEKVRVYKQSPLYVSVKKVIQSKFQSEIIYVDEKILETEIHFLCLVLAGVPNYDTSIGNKLSDKQLIYLDVSQSKEWLLFFIEELNQVFKLSLSISEKKTLMTKLSIAHLSWEQFSVGKQIIQNSLFKEDQAIQTLIEKINQKGQRKSLISANFLHDKEKKQYYEMLVVQLIELKKETIPVTIYLTTNLEKRTEYKKKLEIQQILGNDIQFTQEVSDQTDIILTDSHYMTMKQQAKNLQISSIPYEEKEFSQLVNIVKHIKQLKNKLNGELKTG